MILPNARESLHWALIETLQTLQELDPPDAGCATREVAAYELLYALRGSDVSATGLRCVRQSNQWSAALEDIPVKIWHSYRGAQPLLADIDQDSSIRWLTAACFGALARSTLPRA